MSFLDRLRDTGNLRFDVQRAIMTVVAFAQLADGDVSDEEVARLRAMCALSPIFASNTREQDVEAIKFSISAINTLGNQAIAQAASALSPELRETAFAFACDIILADGIATDEEQKFLAELVRTLALSDEVASVLVQATLIRNRSSQER